MPIVGFNPLDFGRVDVKDGEMLFSMYLPISVPEERRYFLPANLQRFADIVTEVKLQAPNAFLYSYVYLTAKTLWVEGDYIGNRPGWHTDGFGTDDLNFIWTDRAPTEFFCHNLFRVSDDCDESMRDMERRANRFIADGYQPKTYPDRHLLCLDPGVVHRSPVVFEPGMRTFVKVSLSADCYNLKGNAVNPLLPETHWPLVDRKTVRNHPASDQ